MRRWPMAGYWKKFIGTAEKLSVYQTPGSEYNLGNLEYFAIQQAGAASAALIKIIGAERFQELVDERLSSSSNPKYESLIQQYKLEAD